MDGSTRGRRGRGRRRGAGRAALAATLGVLLVGCERPGLDPDRVYLYAVPETQPPAACRTPSTDFDPYPLQLEWHRLLERQDYATLEARIAGFRRDSLERYCSDRPFERAFAALGDASPDYLPHYGAWIAAHPGSAAAYTARARHHLERGWRIRGSATARDTAPDRLQRMREAFARAGEDARAALEREPGFTPAGAVLLEIAQHGRADRATLRMYRRLLVAAPASYVLPSRLLGALSPKWGGSEAAMNAVVEATLDNLDANPDLALLPSLAACHAADVVATFGNVQAGLSRLLAIRNESGEALAPSCRRILGQAYGRQRRDREQVELLLAHLAQEGWVAGVTSLHGPMLRLGRDQELLDAYQRALAVQHGHAELHCLRGQLEARGGDLDAAAAWVERGLVLLADDPSCVREAASLALSRGERVDEALAALQARPQDRQHDLGAQYTLAVGLYNQGRFGDALPAAQRATELAPQAPEAWMLLARTEEHLQHWPQAIAAVNEALRLDPGRAEAWFLRGRARVFGEKSFAQGLTDLRQARTRGERHPELMYAMATAQYRQRDCEFLPNLRSYLEACADAGNCVDGNLAFARKTVGDPGWSRLCP